MRDEYRNFKHDDEFRDFEHIGLPLNVTYIHDLKDDLMRYLRSVYSISRCPITNDKATTNITMPIVVNGIPMNIHVNIFPDVCHNIYATPSHWTGKQWHRKTDIIIKADNMQCAIPNVLVGVFAMYGEYIDDDVIDDIFDNRIIPAILKIHNELSKEKIHIF